MEHPSSAASTATASEITKASKSNLALAFIALPRERREDITLFYAFCRLIDDITDEAGRPVVERMADLAAWRRSLREESPGEPPLASSVRALIAKYPLPLGAFEEIILGCEMDLHGTRYQTWDALRLYCYRVASAVGLVSIEIFGCRDARRTDYAVQLGLALQLTNILRDVGEDLAIGRIYLPKGEMEQFGYSEEDLEARRHTVAFTELMRFQARRASGFYESARAILPKEERACLVAPEIMRAVYQQILEKMWRDDFRVFERRYRLGKAGKLASVLAELGRAKLGLPLRAVPQFPAV